VGAYSAPPDPLAGFMGAPLRGAGRGGEEPSPQSSEQIDAHDLPYCNTWMFQCIFFLVATVFVCLFVCFCSCSCLNVS
jgi:hypothetical protein